MIDWINTELPPACLDNSGLEFSASVITETGELCTEWSEATHGPFKIRVHNRTRRTELRGSLHKYKRKSHNGDAFPRWEVAQAVQQLADELGFDPAQAQLHGLEFGANVPLEASAKGLLRRGVLHGTKPVDSREWGGRGCLLEAEGQQFFFKLYDKEAQLTDTGYSATGPLLRVELKARKMKFLEKAGIKTLADLANPAALEVMGELLLAHLSKMLFSPPGQLPQTLNQSQQRLLREGASKNYWTEQPQPKLRSGLKQYRQLVTQHVQDAQLAAAKEGLRSVWQLLLHQPEPEPAPLVATTPDLVASQITPLSRVLPPSIKEREEARPFPTAEGLLRAEPTPFNQREAERVSEGSKGKEFEETESGAKEFEEKFATKPPTPSAPRCCQTCGRPLNSRNATAKFCSERELGKAAKKCRNAASNPRNNARRRLLKIESQALLFDTRPYVKVPEQIREFVLAA
jgi:hypothetical protein